MHKKLQCLVLCTVLSVSTILTPVFATSSVQETTDITEPIEVEQSEEEPETPVEEEDPQEETQEEIPQEIPERIGKLQISTYFFKIDTNDNPLGEFEIKSIDSIVINNNAYTFNYVIQDGFFVIDLGEQAMELNSDMYITVHYTDTEGVAYSQTLYVPDLLSMEIYDVENKMHMVAPDDMLLAIIEAAPPTEGEPEEDEEEPQEEITPFSTIVPVDDDNKNITINGVELKNAYRGVFCVNSKISSWGEPYYGTYDPQGGVPQRIYVDHIDIRVTDATVTVNHSINGVTQSTEVITGANVTGVQKILIDGEELDYYSYKDRYEENPQFGTQGLEFNFQIAELNTFNYKEEWLDITKVGKITFICTLEGVDSTGNKQTFENVSISIVGLEDIVKKSYCSNASGLDYFLSGTVDDDVIIEIPEPIVPEELNIDLTPTTGDISVYMNICGTVLASAVLIAINKKNNY